MVILPSMPLNIFNWEKERCIVIKVKRLTLEQLKDLIEKHGKNIECYIRHKPTLKLLESILGTEIRESDKMYKYRIGDIIIVVTLAYRQPISGKDVEVSQKDLLVLLAEVFDD